jgi:hypothetical protein
MLENLFRELILKALIMVTISIVSEKSAFSEAASQNHFCCGLRRMGGLEG